MRTQILPPRKPIKVTDAAIKSLIDAFDKTGHSNHSTAASTLQFVIDYCEKNNIGYRVTYVPHGGYFIEKFPITSCGSCPCETPDTPLEGCLCKCHKKEGK